MVAGGSWRRRRPEDDVWHWAAGTCATWPVGQGYYDDQAGGRRSSVTRDFYRQA